MGLDCGYNRALYTTPAPLPPASRYPHTQTSARAQEEVKVSQMVAAYQGRWRHWYEFIADYFIANPGCSIQQCAEAMGKHANTISAIYRTDMFQAFYSMRKEQWRERQDTGINSKMYQLAQLGLDVQIEALNSKRDKIPMHELHTITSSALDKLGFGPKPQAAVAVNVDNRVQIAVGPAELNEAREAMRRAEDAARARARELAILPSPEVALGRGTDTALEAPRARHGEDNTSGAGGFEAPESEIEEAELAPDLTSD